ncbi:hypothetical protein [Mesorhizobium sp. SP-1A]|uniref:hypothetical protein n=1 Tax=Mesorhizobium sp. SP-1A TaxID=3077840 RepID=UPI0028F6DEE8|nr:hypothetical protein [Mesorhizobium sp. SP-1A]
MSHICILFERPEKLEHYDAFLLAKRGLTHVEFENGDSAYRGLGYVEIDPEEHDPLPLCQSLVKMLQDVGAQYCAMVAATDRMANLSAPHPSTSILTASTRFWHRTMRSPTSM